MIISWKLCIQLRGTHLDSKENQIHKFYELREYDKMDQASVVDGGEGNLIQINVLFIAIDNGS